MNSEILDRVTPLTVEDAALLDECERIVNKGIQSFTDVGNALKIIQDGRLYRETHDTFEKYVKAKWDIGRAHAYRLIGSAETMQVLSPLGDILPTAETHVRPLLQFPLEDRPEVWKTVLKESFEPITAREVDRVIRWNLDSAKSGPFYELRIAKKRKKREQRAEHRAKYADAQHVEQTIKLPMPMASDDADRCPDLSPFNNAAHYIQEVLDGGEWMNSQELFSALCSPENRIRSWLNESKVIAVQEERHRLLAEGIVSFDLAVQNGIRIIETTLHAMVWLGLVELHVIDEDVVEYRLIDDEGGADG